MTSLQALIPESKHIVVLIRYEVPYRAITQHLLPAATILNPPYAVGHRVAAKSPTDSGQLPYTIFIKRDYQMRCSG